LESGHLEDQEEVIISPII